jgi:hypothetical protein
MDLKQRMTPSFDWRRLAALTALVASLPGCSSSGKSVVVARDVVPEGVSKRALELYDANNDGKVDGEELKKSPALTSALPRIDANKDGSLSSEEIAARIRAYQSQSDILPISLLLEHRQQPLADAEVAFSPAPFMGENLPVFKGKSDTTGNVALAAEEIDVPPVPVGMYEVSITGPVSQQLGCEVAEDTPTGGRIVLSF